MASPPSKSPKRATASRSRSAAPTRVSDRPHDRAAIPFVSPQLATATDAAPVGEQWFHELKFDGYRVLCRVQNGRVTLFTRSGQDWTDRFAAVATAAAKLALRDALIDGEVAILRSDGTTSFQALQNHLQEKAKGALIYFAFDLLFLDGVDLRPETLEERKAILADLLGQTPTGIIRYTDHIIGNGPAFFEKASAAGLEGIVSKQRDQPYRSGRSSSWLKTKALKRQEFVIGGFTEPEGARSGLGALLVGFFQGGGLSYAGKVGTGFTESSSIAIRRRLDGLLSDRSPFHSVVPQQGREIRWVKPRLVAEIAYGEMTADGKLRHPSFQGLREDKPAPEVVGEPQARDHGRKMDLTAVRAPAKQTAKAATDDRRLPPGVGQLAGVKLTHPERMLEAAARITKRDLANYYAVAAPYILPHLVGRPLSLVRCPEGMAGKCFFMKHAAFATPDLRRVMIKEKEEKGEYLIVDTITGLIGLAQMSVLEIHTWNSIEESLEMPDRVVFDFDPGPKAGWQDVLEGALLVKERVEQIGCTPFVKTTGGKGLHVVVPLTPNAGWDDCKMFSQLVSESIVKQHPKRFTTAMRKLGREDKILIDYFRNHRGSTSVSVYSPRARPGIPVSMPVSWNDLASFAPDRPFTLGSAAELLRNGYQDPWATYEASRVDLKGLILGGKPARVIGRRGSDA